MSRNRKHDGLINALLGAGPALVWAAAIAISALCGGCHAGPSLEFSQGAHKAERAVYGVVAPEYSAYVGADTTLSRTAREDRLALIQAWGIRLGQDSATLATAEASQ